MVTRDFLDEKKIEQERNELSRNTERIQLEKNKNQEKLSALNKELKQLNKNIKKIEIKKDKGKVKRAEKLQLELKTK